MKKVKIEVRPILPSWGFCNLDNTKPLETKFKEKCKYCIKVPGGYKCLLFDVTLKNNPTFVEKAEVCMRATAGFNTIVEEVITTPLPTVDPKQLITKSIKLYSKTLSDLMTQGYPRSIAEEVAMKYVIGD